MKSVQTGTSRGQKTDVARREALGERRKPLGAPRRLLAGKPAGFVPRATIRLVYGWLVSKGVDAHLSFRNSWHDTKDRKVQIHKLIYGYLGIDIAIEGFTVSALEPSRHIKRRSAEGLAFQDRFEDALRKLLVAANGRNARIVIFKGENLDEVLRGVTGGMSHFLGACSRHLLEASGIKEVRVVYQYSHRHDLARRVFNENIRRGGIDEIELDAGKNAETAAEKQARARRR